MKKKYKGSGLPHISINPSSPYSGTQFPVGTPACPVNNIKDAKNIAKTLKAIADDDAKTSGGSRSGTNLRKGNKTPREIAELEVARMHAALDGDEGGWVYNFNTEQYLDHNGEWVDSVVNDKVRIPDMYLEEAVQKIKRVYPAYRIISVTL